MKKQISVVISLLVVPLLALGAALDVNLALTNAQLSVNSYTLVVSGRQSFMDSITVNPTDFAVTTTGSLFLQVTSSDRRAFTVSPTQYKTAATCTGTESTVTIEVPSSNTSSITVTVTPSSTSLCGTDGGSGGGGGGGGGGGSSGSVSTAPIIPAAVSVPATREALIAAIKVKLAELAAKILAAKAQPSATAQVVSPVFNKNLARGAENADVKRLQQLLGVNPVGFFGPATEKAVKEFQKKYGLPQVGYVGPGTRAKLSEVYGAAKVLAAPVTPAAPAPAKAKATPEQLNALKVQIEALTKAVVAKKAAAAAAAAKAAPAPAPAPTPAANPNQAKIDAAKAQIDAILKQIQLLKAKKP